MTTHSFHPQALAPAWHSLQTASPVKLHSVRSDEHYQQLVTFLNQLLDVVGDNEEHELADFLDLVGQLIENYENTHHEVGASAPHEMLRFFMNQLELSQSDLAKELGGQSVVSAILHGKRSINARQAKSLATRFGVSPSVFL